LVHLELMGGALHPMTKKTTPLPDPNAPLLDPNAPLPDPTSQFLNQMPPFFDAFDALAHAMALGDDEAVWGLIRAHKLMMPRMKRSWLAACEHNDEVREVIASTVRTARRLTTNDDSR
jgi:hypothetical protein